ncbi:hypothetical protein LTR36_005625 [Oleoguttula mirabilis]|uniref:Myb-like domain-containing protein n=1 Tax=Oleoguttula mirabilis TaxID=1507867 RepID=A0AAV9JDW9_9PEZI|nr:hypothetical protein LTR36_005625 [Oleoguttula mirabilis]
MADRQHVLVRHLISRPNPIEPQSVPQRHPLNGTPQLAKPHNPGLARILLDTDASNPGERPAKRRRSGDAKSLDLPKLPVRQGTKRLRIPPTLSGLHQPPPNAGLLPSMTTEQRVPIAEKAAAKLPSTPVEDTSAACNVSDVVEGASIVQEPVKTNKLKRNRWSDEETVCLLNGVARFTIGSWTKILNCSDYRFNGRTALDLKDRFRVCCPGDYHPTKVSRPDAHAAVRADDELATDRDDAASRSGSTIPKPRIELPEPVINQTFEKNKRRKRHGYSAKEDEAILKGFRKHGKAWAAMRADGDLCLEHRTATDLRDRMRTKYPEEYSKAGLASRPDIFPKPSKRGKDTDNHEAEIPTAELAAAEASNTIGIIAEKEGQAAQKQMSASLMHQTPLLPLDSVFWGAPFDEEDLDCEPVTLDRGILDWPGDSGKQSSFDNARASGIDPLVSLRLPEPTAAPISYSTSYGLPGSVLPSVASITAVPPSGMDDQFELPSLMIGALEMDGRAGGHFLGFDELLS